MTWVNLQKPVTTEKLEQACIKAAEELGYSAKVKERFKVEYRLGSIHEEKVFDGRVIEIRSVLPALEVVVDDNLSRNRGEKNNFYVRGFPFGLALPHEVRKYLSTVSGYLE